MTSAIRRLPHCDRVQAVILDWAGTAVDYGCMGPPAVFQQTFEKFGITVSTSDAREFMGLEKREHIRRLCALPQTAAQWCAAYGRDPDENDVAALYAQAEAMMVATIARHAEPIDGLLPFVDGLRQRDIKIGSCTGYTAPMMAVLAPAAAARGYRPDCVVCSSDVPAGRPLPWMCYQNAIGLQTFPLSAMIKIGDTVSDVQEGLNAGMWTVGLSQSGNEMGLPQERVAALPADDLKRRLADIEARLRQAGAHYVVAGIWECLGVVDDIQRRLEKGAHPLLAPGGAGKDTLCG
jgi:phosphonoacetaldehyde hydrolase